MSAENRIFAKKNIDEHQTLKCWHTQTQATTYCKKHSECRNKFDQTKAILTHLRSCNCKQNIFVIAIYSYLIEKFSVTCCKCWQIFVWPNWLQ